MAATAPPGLLLGRESSKFNVVLPAQVDDLNGDVAGEVIPQQKLFARLPLHLWQKDLVKPVSEGEGIEPTYRIVRQKISYF